MVPSYNASVTAYICAGNAAVSTFQGGSLGAEFDTSTKLALHNPDGTTLNLADFSASSLTATNAGLTATSGKIGGAALGAASKYATYTNGSALNVTGAFTVSAWVYQTSRPSEAEIFLRGSYGGTGFYVGINGSGAPVMVQGTAIIFSSSATVTPSTWTHLVFVWDGATASIYVNGSSISVSPAGATFTDPSSSTNTAIVGSYDGTQNYLIGRMDEIKVAASGRSANWIATEYANQNALPAAGSVTLLASSPPPIIF
jgi:hypothetical protein